MKNIRTISIVILLGSIGYFTYAKFFSSGKKTEALSDDKTRFRVSDEIQKNHPFTLVSLKDQALEEELQLPGSVSYDMNNVAKVGSRVTGRIIQVFVKEGDYVKKGTALASIQSVELGTTEANYLKARARLEALKVQSDRAKDLYERKVTSAKEYELSLMDYKTVKAEMETSRNALENLGLTEAEILNLESGKYNSKSLLIRTPISGTVTVREAIIGQAVNTRDNLFTVADLSVLWINLEVYEKDLATLKVGREAKVVPIGAKEDSMKAVVSHVGDIVDPIKKTVEIRLEIRNTRGKLRPGQSVTATLIGAMVESSMNKAKVLPNDCIHKIEGETYVFVKNPDKSFSAKKVSVGRIFDQFTEVLGGVEAGELVVDDGSFVLKSEYLKL